MSRTISLTDRIHVPGPCPMAWSALQPVPGQGDRARFCTHCNLHVHDISAMTRSHADHVIADSQGHLCVNFLRDPEGHPIALDRPRALAKAHRRERRHVALARVGRLAACIGLGAVFARFAAGCGTTDKAEMIGEISTLGHPAPECPADAPSGTPPTSPQ